MNNWDDLSKMDLYRSEQHSVSPEWDNAETTGRFMSVNWDAEYHNVVDWVSEEMRESWFKEQEGYDYDFSTNWNLKSLEVFKPNLGRHIGSIKVNIPQESIINFNYLAVELAAQPVPDAGLKKHIPYYYFITTSVKLAPSTTEIYIELDTWTTYFTSIEVQGLQANRGHFAHANTPASVYLQNPLENHYGINEPEPDLPSVKSLVSNEQLISFQKDSPRILIATTADLSDSDSLWLNTADISNVHKESNKVAPPNNWWATSMGQPNSPNSLGYAGAAPVPAVGSNHTTGYGTGVRVYSIAPEAFNGFINTCRNKYPQVIKTIQAVYVLDSALIDEGSSIDFSGYTLKPVQQQNSYKMLDEFKPTKDKFGYKEEYDEFAKLYTEQFAVIEVSNMNGEKVEISVEDISEGLEFYSRSATAFPFLKLEAFINGVGGKEKITYAVKPWNNANAQLFKSSWEDYKFDIDIPVYGVFAEAGEINGPDANADIYKEVNHTQTDFTNTNQSINNAYNNAVLNNNRNNANAVNDYTTRYDNSIADINLSRNNATNNYTTDYNVAIQNTDRHRANATNRYTTDYSNASVNWVRDFTNNAENLSTARNNAEREANFIRNSGIYNKRAADRIADDTSTSEIDTANANYTNTYNHLVNRLLVISNSEINANATRTDSLIKSIHDQFFRTKDIDLEAYNSTLDGNYYNMIVQLYQTLEQSKLEVAVNGMQVQANMVRSAPSPTAMVGTAMDYQIQDFETWKNHEINVYVMTQLYRIQNQGTVRAYPSMKQPTGGTYTSWGWWNPQRGIGILDNVAPASGVNFSKISLSTNIGSSNFSFNGYSASSARMKAELGARAQETMRAELDLATERDYNRKIITDAYDADAAYNRSTATVDRNTTRDNSRRMLNAALYSNNQDKNIAESHEATVRSNAVAIKNTGDDNNVRTRTAAINVAQNSRSKEIAVADRDVSVDKAIALAIRNNSEVVANRDKTVGESIAGEVKSKDTTIAARNLSTDTAIALAIRTTDTSNNARQFATNMRDAGANYYKTLTDEPILFGANEGNAWSDAWGTRGIDVRVKRCSTGIERLAGEQFLKYGYRTTGAWIEEPTLSVMTHFTYWQVDDIWLTTEEVNETNREIIREAFRNGITIWRDPSSVKMVSITNNKILK